jgi:hypothetical protein
MKETALEATWGAVEVMAGLFFWLGVFAMWTAQRREIFISSFKKEANYCVMCNRSLRKEDESKYYKGSHEWCDDCY